jgi:hypothetical protein
MRIFILSLFFFSITFSKNLLWKVENDNATVYITGSIHFGLEEFYPLPSALDSTFKLSDKLVLEINLDSMNAQAMNMMAKMMLPADKSLRSELDSSTYALLSKEFESVGMSIALMERLKPWAAALTLTQLKTSTKSLDPNLGIDKYFFTKAKQQKKEVLQLESVDLQMQVFDSFDKYADKFVLKTIESWDSDDKLIDEMIQAWKDADLEALDEIINRDADDPEYMEITKVLLDDRNYKMVEKIENYLKTNQTYFIVVGAGHLSGKTGLVELLGDKYNIQRL